MPQREIYQCQCPHCQQPDPHPDKILHHHMNLFLSRLDEQQRRWFAALESDRQGHGGDTLLSLITGLHVDTIRRGRLELAEDLQGRPADRIRLPGGGRPPVEKKSPSLVTDLKELVQDCTGGDPEGELQLVRRSLATLSDELAQQGYEACPSTVARLLEGQGYHLHVNVKRFTGKTHPDRDRQFRYLQGQVDRFREADWPIISVDAKKKELLGDFKNAGRKWCLWPEEVNSHDFLQDAWCRAAPYGIYDVLANRGHVCVGLSSDTPAFAVSSIRWWWVRLGCKRYGALTQLLILADAGGSNGCRPRLWKKGLQELADVYGLRLTVCHYPTGASKWNPIEHRLFGPISINWAGEPLRDVETMVGLIRGTTTQSGLVVSASVDVRAYPTKVKVSDREMAELNLQRHDICPQWNYTINPRWMASTN